MRVALACSAYSPLDNYVRRSLARCAANFRSHGHQCDDWQPDGALYIDKWRNEAAQRALEQGADAILYHDADQVILADEATNLAALFDIAPVAGAAYISRQSPPEYVLRVNDGRGGTRPVDAAEMCQRTAPFPVHWIGAGALWVRTAVFKGIPFPWFMSGYRSDGYYVGEDVHFCEQVRAAGVEMVCQPAIVTGHLITSMLVHRPGQVGGALPVGIADKQEGLRCVVGDTALVHYQEARLARLRREDPDGDFVGSGAPATLPRRR